MMKQAAAMHKRIGTIRVGGMVAAISAGNTQNRTMNSVASHGVDRAVIAIHSAARSIAEIVDGWSSWAEQTRRR